MYCDNGSRYFTHDGEMIYCRMILSGTAVSGSHPESVGTFTNLFNIDRALIWDNMVEMFQGSDAWTYLKQYYKYSDRRISYNIIYNHYLIPINIYTIRKLAQKH